MLGVVRVNLDFPQRERLVTFYLLHYPSRLGAQKLFLFSGARGALRTYLHPSQIVLVQLVAPLRGGGPIECYVHSANMTTRGVVSLNNLCHKIKSAPVGQLQTVL